MILAPFPTHDEETLSEVIEQIRKEGYVRARYRGELIDVTTSVKEEQKAEPVAEQGGIEIVIDRLIMKPGIESRLRDSLELALKLGEESCSISLQTEKEWKDLFFSLRPICHHCHVRFSTLQPSHFSLNSPYGACSACDGLQKDSSENRCTQCEGSGLQPFPRRVKFRGITFPEMMSMTVAEAHRQTETFINSLDTSQSESKETLGTESKAQTLSQSAEKVARRLLPEIEKRLSFLMEVGLHYLSLNRSARTLSGGELQRARLASCLGSGLRGICYVLDEPTRGLHPRDTARLLNSLRRLRDEKSTLVIVEHDLDLMEEADLLIDLGPGAGRGGGELVAIGKPKELKAEDHPRSKTLPCFEEKTRLPLPGKAESSGNSSSCVEEVLTIWNACLHNLKGIDVSIPPGKLVCVTGVSGSGKSSLISQTLVPALKAKLLKKPFPLHLLDDLTGTEGIQRILEVDQSSIGRSGRSNPATYSKVWNEVRKLFALTHESRLRGYTRSRFSFQNKQGHCPTCAGHGTQKLKLHFLPDAEVPCALIVSEPDSTLRLSRSLTEENGFQMCCK